MSLQKQTKYATAGSLRDLQSTFKYTRTAGVTSCSYSFQGIGLILMSAKSPAKMGLENLIPSLHHASQSHPTHSWCLLSPMAESVREQTAPSAPGCPPPSQGKRPASSPPPCSYPAVSQHTKGYPACFCFGGEKKDKESLLASCCAKLLPFTSVKSLQFPTEKQISSSHHLHYTSHTGTAQDRAAMHKPTAESSSQSFKARKGPTLTSFSTCTTSSVPHTCGDLPRKQSCPICWLHY